MTQHKFKGKTVDEAIEIALQELSVDLEDVEVAVIKTGRAGILGLGGEAAEIEVELLGPDGLTNAEKPLRNKRARANTQNRAARSQTNSESRTLPKTSTAATNQASTPASSPTDNPRPPRNRNRSANQHTRNPKSKFSSTTRTANTNTEQQPGVRDSEAEALIGEVLEYILAALHVDVEAYVLDDLNDGGGIVFELEGQDAGLLIGNRGETMNALQFLLRLLIKEKLGRPARFVIDIAQYRNRRVAHIEEMALQRAEKALSYGDAVALPPMSSAERRLVHRVLSDNADITTESKGTGDKRHVVIQPS